MAGEDRATASPLALYEKLAREPQRLHFYQVMRLIECAHADRPRLGETLRAEDDPIRLGQEPSLAFAPSLLAGFQPGHEGLPPRLLVWFLGLFGPNGPLPLHLTEYARERMRDFKDPTFNRFADLFHHRMLSLFYRAWANARPAVSFDRPESDRFAFYVGALVGLGTPGLADRDAAPHRAKLFHAPSLAGQSHHPDGLRSILADFFGVRIRLEEFVGYWENAPPDTTLRLGVAGYSGRLGTSASLGTRYWSHDKFRIVMGPMGLADYERLLPGSSSLDRLAAFVRSYAGDELLWDLRLYLRKEDVRPVSLGRSGRLGWTGWIMNRNAEHDAGDVVLRPRIGKSSLWIVETKRP